MKFLVLKALMFFDFFYKRKIIFGLKKLLGNDLKVIFDVGAHNGEMIEIISDKFNVKKIFAFEPNPNCIKKLKKIKKKNLKIFEMALGDKSSSAKLNIGHISSMSTINDINNKSFYTMIKKFVIGVNLIN